jgi:hypothetical protein
MYSLRFLLIGCRAQLRRNMGSISTQFSEKEVMNSWMGWLKNTICRTIDKQIRYGDPQTDFIRHPGPLPE